MESKLNQIKNYVNTQYGDLTGVIQIDGHENISSIYDLCKNHLLDTEPIFIVGFGFGESTINGIGQHDTISCDIFYVEKSEYGENFEDISSKIDTLGKIVLKKKTLSVKYKDLGNYIKRFEFIALSELVNSVKTIEILED